MIVKRIQGFCLFDPDINFLINQKEVRSRTRTDVRPGRHQLGRSCPYGLSGWAFFKTYPSMLRVFFLMLYSLNPVPLYRHVECL